MRKNIFITVIVCLLCSTISVLAQEENNNRERRAFDKEAFQARRSAYITAEIGLTADEAGNFIPLDNEFKEKVFDAGRECRRLGRLQNSKEKLSDSDYIKLIDCQIETKLKEAQLEKEYFEKFKKILSPEKLYKYQQADAKFMREFIGGGGTSNRNRSSNRR